MLADHKTRLLSAGILTAAVVLGIATALIGRWAADSTVRTLVLPATIAFGMLFLYSRRLVFLLIMVIRAPVDGIVATMRIGESGLGAILNAVVILVAILFVIQNPSRFKRPILAMWTPFICLLALATLRSQDLSFSVKTFLAVVSYISVFIAPFYLSGFDKSMRTCIVIVLASSIVPAGYGFVDYLSGGSGGDLGNRIASTFSHPNIFGYYLVLCITLAFYVIKSPLMGLGTFGRWAMTGYLFVLLVLLEMTGGRAAWAGCLFVFVMYGVLFERKFLIYLVVFMMLGLALPPIQDRLAELFEPVHYVSTFSDENSYEWRKHLWADAMAWLPVSAYPLGEGLNSFFYYSSQFSSTRKDQVFPHSVYIQIFFEMGIAGLLTCGWFLQRIFKLLRSGYRRDQLGTVLMLITAAEYLVFCYSDNMIYYLTFNWYFMFVMGTACSICFANRIAAEGVTTDIPSSANATGSPGRPSSVSTIQTP